jgi:hypothetical protein
VNRFDSSALQTAGFEWFVYADVGVGPNGTALTVVYALPRRGFGPWLEAQRLADRLGPSLLTVLPKYSAPARLPVFAGCCRSDRSAPCASTTSWRCAAIAQRVGGRRALGDGPTMDDMRDGSRSDCGDDPAAHRSHRSRHRRSGLVAVEKLASRVAAAEQEHRAVTRGGHTSSLYPYTTAFSSFAALNAIFLLAAI